jgi:hypothetical protein
VHEREQQHMSARGKALSVLGYFGFTCAVVSG